jgi:acetyl-CoA carboxylase carboxyl transferase subunit alpha
MKQDEIERKIEELKRIAQQRSVDISQDLSRLQEKLTKGQNSPAEAWRKVELARNSERPTTLDLVDRMSDGEFLEFHGDRCFGEDQAIVGGIARIGGRMVTFIGHQKGRTMKENIRRNYGMGHPEGYRKALRLAQQAEKFHRPIITFIDTAGAYPGLGSEERSVGEAIARNLKVFSTLKVPIICFIIGEGGSGGALGIGVGNEVYMLENTVYSVISPEGCATILLRDASRAQEAAALLKMTAVDLLQFGIIDGILSEPLGGAQMDYAATAAVIQQQIQESLSRLMSKSPDQLIRERVNKIMSMGRFVDEAAPKQGFLQRLFSIK